MSFRRATFSLLSILSTTKALHKLCLGQLCQSQRSQIRHQVFDQVISGVAKIADFGHKYGKGLKKWATRPHSIFFFLGVPPRVENQATFNFSFVPELIPLMSKSIQATPTKKDLVTS